jgi:hypothetical protein
MGKRGSGKTGPVTPEGKANSSLNATTHGMCSKAPVVAGEDGQERERLVESWLTKYRPVDDVEHRLVMEVAENEWFKRRAMKQFGLVEERMNAVDPFEWSEEEHKRMERFLRYKTTAERAFTRSLRTLEQQHKIRVDTERSQAAAAKVEAAAQAEFVKKNPPPLKDISLEQRVVVEIVEGKTATWAYPTTEMLLRQTGNADESTLVYRVIEFPQGVPAEYGWAKRSEDQGQPGWRFGQKMRLAVWLKVVAREKASGSEHLGRCDDVVQESGRQEEAAPDCDAGAVGGSERSRREDGDDALPLERRIA